MQNQKLRITLAQTQTQLTQLQQEVFGLRQTASFASEVIAALVACVGEELVAQEIDRQREKRQSDAEAQQAEGVKAMVEQGILKVVDVVGPKSFLVGQDIFDVVAGQPVRRPMRVQFEAANIKPELQSNYLGKKVGDEVVIPSAQPGASGGRFVINEIYDIDVVKAVENAQRTAGSNVPVEGKPLDPIPFVDEPASQPPLLPAANDSIELEDE